jgi:hypothetical protein
MTQPVPSPVISVLRDSHDCVGFLRSAGPRGFQAYDSASQPLGLFQDNQASDRSNYGREHLNSTGDHK